MLYVVFQYLNSYSFLPDELFIFRIVCKSKAKIKRKKSKKYFAVVVKRENLGVGINISCGRSLNNGNNGNLSLSWNDGNSRNWCKAWGDRNDVSLSWSQNWKGQEWKKRV